MKICILSRHQKLYSTKRLKEAALAKGHEVQVIDYLRCYMNIAAHNPQIFFKKKRLVGIDAVIPRIGAPNTFYGTAVVRQFEMMHIYCLSSSQGILRSRDKLRCLQILSQKGVGLPVTGFANSTKDIKGVINMVGGAPLVIKLIEGTQGIGVVLTETYQAAESVIEAFRGLNANILVQEYVKEASGTDIRCFVVGDKVIASMKRTAKVGEFRSNIHRGAKACTVRITPEERSTAVNAAKIMGLKIAGVDILRSNRGPVVMEVNSSPGLEGIEMASGKDIASEIIRYLEKHAPNGCIQDKLKG